MVDDVPNGEVREEGPIPELPRGEPWVPRRRGLAARLSALPRGPVFAGLAVAVTAGALLLFAGPNTGRFPELPTALRRRRAARAKGIWAGVLAATGRTVASTLARRLAEDLLENGRRQRAGTTYRGRSRALCHTKHPAPEVGGSSAAE